MMNNEGYLISQQNEYKESILIEKQIDIGRFGSIKISCLHVKIDEIYSLINCLQEYVKKTGLKEKRHHISFEEYIELRNSLIREERYEEVILLDKKHKNTIP